MSMEDNGRKPQLTHIFCDNEGCLIPGKGLDMPLEELAQLARLLRAHPWLNFSLCTGRSIPYVECMTQILGLADSELPQVCEGGAALYWPAREKHGHSKEAPAYEPLSSFVVDDFVKDLNAYLDHSAYRVELGKISCLSLYPNDGWTVGALYGAITKHHPSAKSFSIQQSVAAVDITPFGIDKASGLRTACARIGITLENVACIGDSGNDLPMMRIAGFSACPRNATDQVKDEADFVAESESTAGVIQIVKHVIQLHQNE